MCRIENGRNMQLSSIQQERGAYQTTHPPVLVPPMRAQSSYGRTAFSPSFSRSAFTSAIKALRMSSVESPRTPLRLEIFVSQTSMWHSIASYLTTEDIIQSCLKDCRRYSISSLVLAPCQKQTVHAEL